MSCDRPGTTATFGSEARFNENTANNNGGGAYTSLSSILTSDAHFLNNTAAWSGGGIYMANGNGTTPNSGAGAWFTSAAIFDGNTATSYDGGAIYIGTFGNSSVTLDGQFIGNRAATSGAGRGSVVYVSTIDSDLDGNGLVLNNNVSYEGAIWSRANVNFSGLSSEGNESGGAYGSVFYTRTTYDPDLICSGCDLSGNNNPPVYFGADVTNISGALPKNLTCPTSTPGLICDWTN